MKHKSSFIVVYVCLLALFAAGLGVLIFGEKEARPSEAENRMLQGFPPLDAGEVLSGRFMESFEAYLSDAFLGRDALAGLSQDVMGVFSVKDADSSPLDLGGKQLFEERPEDAGELEWVLEAGADGAAATPAGSAAPAGSAGVSQEGSMWLVNAQGEREVFQSFTAPQLGALAQALNAYRACLPPDGTVNFVYVPTADYAYKLSYGSYTGWGTDIDAALQPALSQGVYAYNAPALFEPLMDTGAVYPVSDHHWHSLGACMMAGEMLQRQGVVPTDYYEYEYYLSSRYDDVRFDRAALESMAVDVNDFQVLKPVSPVKSYILTHLTQREDCVFIDRRAAGYKQFLGGTYTPWRLFETGFHTGRGALVIGDSFSNSFIPYLAPYYDDIISVDFRDSKYNAYEAGANAAAYMEEYGVCDVYVVYCTMTPISDVTLQDRLERYLHLDYN